MNTTIQVLDNGRLQANRCPQGQPVSSPRLLESGEIFRLNGVKFDGFNNGVLIDVKGPGYAKFISNGEFRTWFNGYKGLIDQARRQIIASNGMPIEWHFAEEVSANVVRRLLAENELGIIKIIFTAPVP